jgi:hypothetical protein
MKAPTSGVALSRMQRLQAAEKQIAEAAADIANKGVEIGLQLIGIRDNELWKETHPSWNQYLATRGHELVDKSFAQAAKLIVAAEVSRRLPDKNSLGAETVLTASHYQELGRLVPTVPLKKEQGKGAGTERDFTRLRPQTLARVLDRAAANAPHGTPSVQDVRRSVDKELGIDRAAQAKETKRQREEAAQPELGRYLIDLSGSLEVDAEKLATVNQDAWKWLERKYPGLVPNVIAGCKSLLEVLEASQR